MPVTLWGFDMRATRISITAAAAALLMISLTACSTSSGSTSGAPGEAPEAVAPTIGVAVIDGDVEFVVNSVTCTEEPMDDGNFAPLAPDGQYCKVNVSATALDDIGMFLGDITITTAQISGEVTEDIAAMMYAGALKADYIDEGQTLTGDVVFDIAKDDSVATVLLKENPLSKGVVVPVE